VNLDLCSSLNGFANLLLHVEQFAEARVVTQRAIDIRQRVLGARHPSLQRSFTLMAKIENAAEEPARALQWSNKSIDLIKMGTTDDSPALLAALVERSIANDNLENFSEVLTDTDIVIGSQWRNSNNNTLFETYRVRADALFELGRSEEAVHNAENALLIQQQIWPGDTADSSMVGILPTKRRSKYVKVK
jgi:tetratricopeptide (TPR) repeat protein